MEFPAQFSEREKAVVELFLHGKSNKQIALSLGVTQRTIEFHLGNIFAKLGVRSRSEAILMITSHNHSSSNRSVVDNLRESTVVSSLEVGDNVEKLASPPQEILDILGKVIRP
jgi:DNA-binding CsgD family transcriptional regulator